MFKLFGAGAEAHGDTTLIAAGASIEGVIRFRGTLEIEGEVRGSIIAVADDGNAVVRILRSGRVEGEVRAPVVVVNGSVDGPIHSGLHVELAEHAKVNGDVHYNLIEMIKGAHLNGKLVFSEAPEPAAEPAQLPVFAARSGVDDSDM